MNKLLIKLKWEAPAEREMDPTSQTLPDQSMSLQEILRRYAQGRPIYGDNREPTYSDQFIPDMRKLDLVERDELIEQKVNEYKDIRTRVRNSRKVPDPLKPKQDDNPASDPGA